MQFEPTYIILLIFFFWLFIYWGASLWREYKQENRRKFVFARVRYLLSIALLTLIPMYVVNNFFPKPHFDSPQERIEFGEREQEPRFLAEGYYELLQQDSLNVDYNFYYIFGFHHASSQPGGPLRDVNVFDLIKAYQLMAINGNPEESEIGRLGIGFCQLFRGSPDMALAAFDGVKNKKLKYLNYGIARSHYIRDEYKEAEKHYRAEIDAHGHLEGAYRGLITIYKQTGNDSLLTDLVYNKEARQYFTPREAREVHYKNGDVLNYIAAMLQHGLRNLNLFGFIGAFMVMIAWLLYLKRVDFYETEHWLPLITTLLLGMLFTYLVFPMSDFFEFTLNFGPDGSILQDFWYCVLGIGAVEELAKTIPLLIILFYTKIIDEPYDFILYSAVSALGFAFAENLIYYKEAGLDVISARAMMSVVAHMFFSSIIAYGMVLAVYRHRKHFLYRFPIYFIIAALAHGFYDFWLINPIAKNFWYLTLVFFLGSIHVWVTIKNNALNNTSYYNIEVRIRNGKLRYYLVLSLVGIIMFEYIVIGWDYGKERAIRNFTSNFIFNAFFIFYLSSSLSRYDIIAGHWAPVRIPLNPLKIFWPRSSSPRNYVGMRVTLNNSLHNQYLKDLLPVKGIIINRKIISGDTAWFVVQLDSPVVFSSFVTDKIIVKARHDYHNFVEDEDIPVYFLMIPDILLLDKEDLKTTELAFMGWAVLNRDGKATEEEHSVIVSD